MVTEFIEKHEFEASMVFEKYKYPFTRQGMHFIGFISRRFDVAKHRIRKEYWKKIFDLGNSELWEKEETEKKILVEVYFDVQEIASKGLVDEIFVDKEIFNELKNIDSGINLFNLIEKYVRTINDVQEKELGKRKKIALEKLKNQF